MEEVDLHAALPGYMAAVGVTALEPAAKRLPDGSGTPTASRGMARTVLLCRGDGRWRVGNGLVSAQPLCFTRLSADLATLEAEFHIARLGLGNPPGPRSVQGMCVDAADPNRMWVSLKLGGGGGTAYLFAFDMADETMVQAPVALLPPSCNGIADDDVPGTLLIAQYIGAGMGGLIRID